jgi:hypothetical protein
MSAGFPRQIKEERDVLKMKFLAAYTFDTFDALPAG